ncbi:MAG TPA: M23 family metallopeptidase [Verrucomicrobiae bacterium]|jgi:murein DD-endopeptidase MepM/ murein hydrolase activator NlpD|nr:M23 family metallopeptidase [Verrucomicrobiae bacterium]
MSRAWLIAIWITLCAARLGAEELLIVVRPAEVYQGGIAEIAISGHGVADVKAVRGAEELPVFPGEDGGSYFALAGVDLEQRPGSVEIVLRGRSEAEAWKRTAALKVRAKDFPREEITVPPAFDQLDAPTLERVKREQAALDRIWKIRTPPRLWRGAFIAPVPGTVNSAFGFRRIVNGLARAPHGGVDLKAALGADVAAANTGRVVLTDDFFFSGKSLVLDHGGGLYTMYFHLSEFRATMGSEVHKGQIIGQAGMTGRVTGPHLHWGARLNGARIDPLGLLDIRRDALQTKP